MSFNASIQPISAYDRPFSDIEFNEILRSIDGNVDPYDSSFDLDAVFPYSEQSSMHNAGTTLDDNGTYSPLDIFGYEPPQQSESTRKPLPRDAVRVLEQWFEQNSDHPYPTKQEKASLAEQTDRTLSQVSMWFANARRRRKRGPARNGMFTGVSHDHLTATQQTSNEQPSSPLDRWRNSPPEIEAAPLEAIMSAVANNVSNSASFNADEIPQNLPNDDARSQVSSKASGSALSNSSGSSAYSFSSNNSHGSFGRFYLNETRTRRRRRTQNSSMLSKDKRKPRQGRRPYQCTFCTDTFRTKHDWTRHEKTLHLALESFTCSPSGPTYTDSSEGNERCVFCDNLQPDDSHIEAHRFSICQEKPSTFRTFYRKDHLVQHLRLVHGVSHLTPSMESWTAQVTHIRSRCGFCGERFEVWAERNDHIAQHFRKGALMKEWRGCRGLDPPVALAVENAMPPYLIGVESTGLDPFSASRLGDKGDTQKPAAVEVKPTPFEYLTARLTQFVHDVQATGGAVTDEMLQKEARCIMYNDDDPWNQTAADNPEWLDLFKDGLGIGSAGPPQCATSNHPEGEDYSFCLPWSADRWAPSHPPMTGLTADSLGMDSCTPWSWQSPECLAEFRQNTMAMIVGAADQDAACQLLSNAGPS